MSYRIRITESRSERSVFFKLESGDFCDGNWRESTRTNHCTIHVSRTLGNPPIWMVDTSSFPDSPSFIDYGHTFDEATKKAYGHAKERANFTANRYGWIVEDLTSFRENESDLIAQTSA